MQRKFAVGTIDKLAGGIYTSSVSTAIPTQVMALWRQGTLSCPFLHGFSVNFHWIRVVVVTLCVRFIMNLEKLFFSISSQSTSVITLKDLVLIPFNVDSRSALLSICFNFMRFIFR